MSTASIDILRALASSRTPLTVEAIAEALGDGEDDAEKRISALCSYLRRTGRVEIAGRVGAAGMWTLTADGAAHLQAHDESGESEPAATPPPKAARTPRTAKARTTAAAIAAPAPIVLPASEPVASVALLDTGEVAIIREDRVVARLSATDAAAIARLVQRVEAAR